MAEKKRQGQSNHPALARRRILLGSTTLVASSVLGSSPSMQVAQAQQAAPSPATPGGQKPNIIVIMADDIGWSNIGVYNQGIMAGRTPNLDRMANRGCGSPITTPRRAARPDEPISSLASCRSARV